MNYQWYPGHMTKAKRQMQEDIRLIDLVIELVDARIPQSSRNPEIDVLGKNKGRLILLNKADLADEKYNRLWMDYFKKQGYFVLPVNSKRSQGLKPIQAIAREACQEKIARDKRRGMINRPIRAMVVGIPNVGKSTFINAFTGRASTKTGNKPGITKGKQWIRLNKDLELLDTPGILWPKFEDQAVGLRLAMIGSIKDDIIDITELSLEIIGFLKEHYPLALSERYDIMSLRHDITRSPGAHPPEAHDFARNHDIMSEEEDNYETLKRICANRRCFLKGEELHLSRAAGMVVDDFRNGRLGRITIDRMEC
jgi:ribosome biogenesis GTPase A